MDTNTTKTEARVAAIAEMPQVGDVVLYVTHRPAVGGGVDMTRIAALVTAVNADFTLELTAFHPGADPVIFHTVSLSVNGSYGGWEPRPPKASLTMIAR